MSDTPVRVAVAERAARAGAAVAADAFRGELAVETKAGKTDVVTAADREAQRRVRTRIGEVYPEEPIVGEEGEAAKTVPASGPAWVVDPIDGTNNFVRGHRLFATAVAAVVDAQAVAAAVVAPALGDAYVADATTARRDDTTLSVSDRADPEVCAVVPTIWWPGDRRDEYARATTEIVERFADLRRIGSAQLALSLLAAGAVDGVVTNVRANPWDTVAGVHLVRCAGGRVTDLEGEPWRPDATGLVASNGAIHDEVLAAARAIDPPTPATGGSQG
jgi:myo-inositol-1(or 4)-monophosphatase